jgi:hypothetical protein
MLLLMTLKVAGPWARHCRFCTAVLAHEQSLKMHYCIHLTIACSRVIGENDLPGGQLCGALQDVSHGEQHAVLAAAAAGRY